MISHLWGLTAWLVWAFIHLMYIVEFQSRVVVFVKWAIQDVTFSRGARLITGVASSDFNFDDAIAAGEQRAVETKNESVAAAVP